MACKLASSRRRLVSALTRCGFTSAMHLLPRPPRTQGGFRRYSESDVDTLAFIRRVQGLGFKLSEIRGLLNLRGNRLQPCAPVRHRLEEKLSDVQRIRELFFQSVAHRCTRLQAVSSQIQETANLAEFESQALHAADKSERVHVAFGVSTESALRSWRSREQVHCARKTASRQR